MKLEFVELSGFRGFRDKVRFNLARGFTVLNGHNGTGKSTVLDAVDFALTGTINKFSVKAAKGGGLDEHIWWVGSGKAEAHFVSVGFVNDADERFVVTRSRESGCSVQPSEITSRLCSQRSAQSASVETLLQTTLIRDEFIAGLSLDLPEQTRFTLVREAIGSMVGPDYSGRKMCIRDRFPTGCRRNSISPRGKTEDSIRGRGCRCIPTPTLDRGRSCTSWVLV